MLRSWSLDVRRLRRELRVSRAEFSRFLGVSEATVVRWESDSFATEPRGVQAVLIQALLDAAVHHPSDLVARLVRLCELDHRAALRGLLEAAATGAEPSTLLSNIRK